MKILDRNAIVRKVEGPLIYDIILLSLSLEARVSLEPSVSGQLLTCFRDIEGHDCHTNFIQTQSMPVRDLED